MRLPLLGDVNHLPQWAASLVRTLESQLADMERTKQTRGRTHHLRNVTVAELPEATPAGKLLYVSDEVGGATVAFSDGTNWRRVTDNAIVS